MPHFKALDKSKNKANQNEYSAKATIYFFQHAYTYMLILSFCILNDLNGFIWGKGWLQEVSSFADVSGLLSAFHSFTVFIFFLQCNIFRLLWELHTIQVIMLVSRSSWVRPPILVPSPHSLSPIVLSMYSLQHDETPRDQPLKENRGPPPAPPEAIKSEELHFSILIIVLQDSLSMASCLYCFFWGCCREVWTCLIL